MSGARPMKGWRWPGPGLACLALLLPPAAAWAKPLPDAALHVRQVAQDVPVNVLLQQLAAPAGLQVAVSARITGAVNGVFEGPLEAVLTKVCKAFAAAYYYDGKTLFFYPAADRTGQTFAPGAAQAQWVRSEANRLGATDASDTLQVQGGELIVSGAPQFVSLVAGLVHRAPGAVRAPSPAPVVEAAASTADAPQPVAYRVYYLHYAWAADSRISAGDRTVFVPGVSTILRALVAGAPDGGSEAVAQVSAKPAAQPGLAGTGLAAAGGTAGAVTRPQANTLAGLFGLASATAAEAAKPAEPASAVASTSERAPKAPVSHFRVEADPRLNALIVRDTAANLDQYGPLIAALDVEPTLVEIEATIIDIDVERARQSGFTLNFQTPNGSGFSSSLDGTIPSFPQPGGASVSAVIGNRNQFMARLEALETDGTAHIVSSPLVMTLSDVEASFQNDQTFYVPVNGSLSTDLYNVTAGTNLRVTPHVVHDGGQERIRLIVEIDDGALSNQLVGNIPVVEKASLNTETLILSGQSLLVGGMVARNDTDYRSKVPVASAVPILGQLFRAGRKTSGHTERLFLITPRLAAVGAPATAPAGTQGLPPNADVQSADRAEARP